MATDTNRAANSLGATEPRAYSDQQSRFRRAFRRELYRWLDAERAQ